MTAEKIRIGVISPSGFFVETAKQVVCKIDPNIQLTTAQATRFEAVPLGLRMEAEGVEVVVSRHGTARQLRQNLSIPVLSVPLTSFQLFQFVQKASKMGRKILILTYHEYFEGLSNLEEIFNVGIIHVNRNESEFEDIEKCIIYGLGQGCQVVMGGKVTAAIAQRHGLKSLEIPVSPPALLQTLTDAYSVARSRRIEVELKQRYRTILDTVSEGIIGVDPDGRVTTLNTVAKSILKIQGDPAPGTEITTYFDDPLIFRAMREGQRMRNQLLTISGSQYLMDHVPILKDKRVLGGIITIQNVSELQVAEHEVRRSMTRRLVAKYTIDDFFGDSAQSVHLTGKVKKFARHDTTVLILGQTGTGKEIISQSIHNLSKRRTGPFVSFNCGAIPESLLESELFGYDEGAFTGSQRGGKPGLFELAHNGTIFLDEIGDAPPSVQSRLLRVLQEREVMRIGGDRLIPVDVRVVAATNKNLARQVAKGRFREDLYFRLNILNLVIPPLSARISDLPLLTLKLIDRKARDNGLVPISLPGDCLERMTQLFWPGNVRQLANFVEKLLILSEGKFSRDIFNELHEEMRQYELLKTQPRPLGDLEGRQSRILKDKTRNSEEALILKVLEEEGFVKKRAAQRLGISRATLWRKIRALNLSL